MEVKAKARYIRMSPRKVRLVAGLVRGMGVGQAEAHLGLLNKAAALPVLKLLRSAVANAEHNHKLEKSDLFIKMISVDGGPVLKRWRPRAFGRAGAIRKRTSHINLILAARSGADGKSAAGLKAAVVKGTGKGKDKTEKEPKAEKAAAAKDGGKKADKEKKPAAKKADKEKKSEAKSAAAKKPADKKPKETKE